MTVIGRQACQTFMSLAQEAKRRQPKVFAAVCEAVEAAEQAVNRGSTHRRRQNENPSKTQDLAKVDTCEAIGQDSIVLSAVEEQALIEGKQPYTKMLGDSIWEAPTADTLPDLGQLDDDEHSEIDDESEEEDDFLFADLEGAILDDKLEATANVSVEPLQLPGLAAALQESEGLAALIALMQDAEELVVTKNDC
jgi:hypothetical protein